jgi:hypothetical protein
MEPRAPALQRSAACDERILLSSNCIFQPVDHQCAAIVRRHRIVNEPSKPEDAAGDKTRPPPPTAATAQERSLFDDLFAVARALVASRSGHEDESAASLKSVLAPESRLYEIGVYEFAPPDGPAANDPCRLRPIRSAGAR